MKARNMGASQRILLYGNSVILGTLGVSLRRCAQFQVIILLPPFPGKKRLVELNPDIVFFDLEASHTEALFSLLESCPKLMLVGISPDTNLVKIWSGQQLQELSTQGLLEAIRERLKSPAIGSSAFNQSVLPPH
jgi:hypothetical protein